MRRCMKVEPRRKKEKTVEPKKPKCSGIPEMLKTVILYVSTLFPDLGGLPWILCGLVDEDEDISD